ncbi:NAD+ synthase [Nocardioides luteus]|uniref:NH(3)-dependent NAD(+) synthetase n=1 Tax=Nocardioides luteus TaxID=1844 RepID=A0ABQ5SUZ0_9ACTN|nr:NAD(+) synthase [Nocardioides luteus]MDR7309234.1 NAD+ synthase [Nocardioides luteus]GGR48894.1 NH(3)-dependent NAD(+) synthetase [Nocardioides luteus]GLJ67639.1 NH(3)-dependent NAD(+) synthetase [Nocardioides luteus]
MTIDTSPQAAYGPDTLSYDEEAEAIRIGEAMRRYLVANKRKGIVLGVSGGIDSSVVAALAVKALGPERVLALHMPEQESSDDTIGFSTMLTDALGIDSVLEEISPVLIGLGAYQRRDDAVRRVVPEYGPGWKSKIVLPSVVDSDAYRLFSVVVEDPQGRQSTHRLTTEAYLEIVAATNFKQRVRKALEYFHADRLNYAVAGTPNRLEYDQGFFVKLGDGAADLKPIAHLYKTQVYAMAAHLGVPAEIQARPSTTDTYSLEQSQEEFYFSLPYQRMDLCLYGLNHGIATAEVAEATGLTVEQVERVYRDIVQKRRTTAYLHSAPMLVDEVPLNIKES